MKKVVPAVASPKLSKRFWVWVTGPDYYLDEGGSEVAYLDPHSDPAERPDNWWTCHRDTAMGDLVLLYRSLPKSDLAYLFEARSKAKIWRMHPPGTLTLREYGKRVHALLADPQHAALIERYKRIQRAGAKLGLRGPHLNELLDLGQAEVPTKYSGLWKDHQKWQLAVGRALGIPPEYEFAGEWEGSWVCDYDPRFKLSVPVTRASLKSDRYLVKEWPAFRANFRQRVYEIPASIWDHLIELISRTNPGFQLTVNGLMGSRASEDIISEKHLEDALERNLHKLLPEFHVELFQADDGTTGRQYPCAGQGGAFGFIDLLCTDRRTHGLLVIELKVVRAGQAASAQLRTYIGWVREHVANGMPVRGLLISDGVDEKFRYACSGSDDISTLDLSDVRARLAASRP